MNAKELAESARAKAIRKHITVNGRNVIYFEYPSEQKNALTLLMVHGYRGNHHGLEAIAAGLASYRVIIPDLPGFGESEPLKAIHSIENYANWLRAFVSEIGLEDDPHLMGHSFGTLLVGSYATTYPVSSLALVNPVSSPALRGKKAVLTGLTKVYYRLSLLAPDFLGQWLLRNKIAVMLMSVVMAKTQDRRLRRWIHRQHIENFSDFHTVQVATEGYQASISTDLSELAPGIKAPVLVIAASLDDITDIETQRRVVKKYPRAELREITGVGHLVHYEAPDQAAALIAEFLERQ